jgi:hypothetical protein
MYGYGEAIERNIGFNKYQKERPNDDLLPPKFTDELKNL